MINLTNNPNKSQTGMVSILVTVIIMLVLGLITIGFARLALREQRQSLDRQLSTGAFYAAESGVNDAVDKLKTATLAQLATDYTSTCDSTNSASFANTFGLSGILDGTNVQYTCLLVDTSPTTLEYGNIDTNSSTVIPIISKNAAAITSITIMWQDTTGNTGTSCTSALGSFPVANGASGWPSGCNAGVLRFDLVPGATVTRDALTSGVQTAFLQPRSAGAGTISYLARDALAAGNCSSNSTPKICKVTISNGLGGSQYYLRLRSIYKPNAVTICVNTSDCNTASTKLVGSQAVVDSTGKDVDVLRRISVRVPITTIFANNGDVPDFAIGSKDNICKRFAAYPGGATDQATPACSF
jgi:Tfp pilus assembly protein PilX